MKLKLIALALFGISVSTLITSCASSGVLTSAYITNVELSKANYKIVTTSIMGEATARYLFGASFGIGMYTQTMALIPLSKDRQLYKLAMQDLWKNFEAKYGSPVGRKLALVNIRYDSESLNVILYTQPRVTLIADVIEFTD